MEFSKKKGKGIKMFYAQSEIYQAAIKAYSKSACNDPEYHARKAELFVDRCVKAHNFEHNDEEQITIDYDAVKLEIHEQYISNVAYSALDGTCERALWSELSAIEVASQME